MHSSTFQHTSTKSTLQCTLASDGYGYFRQEVEDHLHSSSHHRDRPTPSRMTLNEAIASIWTCQEMLDSTPAQDHIFTDGSFSRGVSGAAAIAYHESTVVAEVYAHTGSCTNNYAELYAIVLGLRWIADNIHTLKQQPHFAFFTDSSYVQTSLTSQRIPAPHFFTVQEIAHLTGILESEHSASFTIHKIPSHLETKTISDSVGFSGTPTRHASVPYGSFIEPPFKNLQLENEKRLFQSKSSFKKSVFSPNHLE